MKVSTDSHLAATLDPLQRPCPSWLTCRDSSSRTRLRKNKETNQWYVEMNQSPHLRQSYFKTVITSWLPTQCYQRKIIWAIWRDEKVEDRKLKVGRWRVKMKASRPEIESTDPLTSKVLLLTIRENRSPRARLQTFLQKSRILIMHVYFTLWFFVYIYVLYDRIIMSWHRDPWFSNDATNERQWKRTVNERFSRGDHRQRKFAGLWWGRRRTINLFLFKCKYCWR